MYRGVAAETPATDAAVAATRGSDRHLRRRARPSRTSSRARADTPRTSRTSGRVRPPSRGCGACRIRYDGAGGDPYHHWTRQMSCRPRRGGKLGSLVKGKLIGIKVTQHGRLAADRVRRVDRDAGDDRPSPAASSRTRSGCSPRWASFTTISSSPVRRSRRRRASRAAISAERPRSQMERVRSGELVDASRTLHGNVVPGARRARDVEVQRREALAAGARCCMRARRRRRYYAALASRGRIASCTGGLAGPSVGPVDGASAGRHALRKLGSGSRCPAR